MTEVLKVVGEGSLRWESDGGVVDYNPLVCGGQLQLNNTDVERWVFRRLCIMLIAPVSDTPSSYIE